MNQPMAVDWITVCHSNDLIPNIGVCALVTNTQIAIFKIDDALYAIENHDPFSQANVLSRGIVGDLKGHLVVASPIYKQHFDLINGQCLEDESVRLNVYAVREENGMIQVAV